MAIIVGDIHGDREKAQAFLDYRPDALHIALGDYLDSFTVPFTQQVECLNLLMDSEAVLLLGNHECHYLRKPLFRFPGYQLDHAAEFQDILEYNLFRFKVAYAIDGWLLTHAELHQGYTIRCDDVDLIANRLQLKFDKYLQSRLVNRHASYRYKSIFEFNFKMFVDGNLLPTNIKQIFGHVEVLRPIVEPNYIALDSTNHTNSCWVYDTELQDLVQLPLEPKIGRVRFQGGGWM